MAEYEPDDSRNITGTASTPDGRWTSKQAKPPRGVPGIAPPATEEEAARIAAAVKAASTDQEPLEPQSENPSLNSEIQASTEIQSEVTPEQYPAEDRAQQAAIVGDGESKHQDSKAGEADGSGI
ncbi:MAG: hypothetical protein U1E37_13475 [Sphingomonadaceae bacterium]